MELWDNARKYKMIHWIWVLAAFIIGWITGALVVWIILGGDEDGKR